MCALENYRAYCVYKLNDGLRMLDFERVYAKEREEAKKMFEGDDGKAAKAKTFTVGKRGGREKKTKKKRKRTRVRRRKRGKRGRSTTRQSWRRLKPPSRTRQLWKKLRFSKKRWKPGYCRANIIRTSERKIFCLLVRMYRSSVYFNNNDNNNN